MKVKLLTEIKIGYRPRSVGTILDVTEEFGVELIASGKAVDPTAKKKKK